MTDAIDDAISRSSTIKTPPVPAFTAETKIERIKKLPLIKTPELIQREAEAEAQHVKAEADRIKLLQKEQLDVEVKKVIYTNNPQGYSKVEKYIDKCTEINKVRDERIPTSKGNVTLSKKSFTFPIKKKVTGDEPPEPPPPAPTIPLKQFD